MSELIPQSPSALSQARSNGQSIFADRLQGFSPSLFGRPGDAISFRFNSQGEDQVVSTSGLTILNQLVADNTPSALLATQGRSQSQVDHVSKASDEILLLFSKFWNKLGEDQSTDASIMRDVLQDPRFCEARSQHEVYQDECVKSAYRVWDTMLRRAERIVHARSPTQESAKEEEELDSMMQLVDVNSMPYFVKKDDTKDDRRKRLFLGDMALVRCHWEVLPVPGETTTSSVSDPSFDPNLAGSPTGPSRAPSVKRRKTSLRQPRKTTGLPAMESSLTCNATPTNPIVGGQRVLDILSEIVPSLANARFHEGLDLALSVWSQGPITLMQETHERTMLQESVQSLLNYLNATDEGRVLLSSLTTPNLYDKPKEHLSMEERTTNLYYAMQLWEPLMNVYTTIERLGKHHPEFMTPPKRAHEKEKLLVLPECSINEITAESAHLFCAPHGLNSVMANWNGQAAELEYSYEQWREEQAEQQAKQRELQQVVHKYLHKSHRGSKSSQYSIARLLKDHIPTLKTKGVQQALDRRDHSVLRTSAINKSGSYHSFRHLILKGKWREMSGLNALQIYLKSSHDDTSSKRMVLDLTEQTLRVLDVLAERGHFSRSDHGEKALCQTLEGVDTALKPLTSEIAPSQDILLDMVREIGEISQRMSLIGLGASVASESGILGLQPGSRPEA